MIRRLCRFSSFSGALVLLCTPLLVQGQQTRFYVRGDVGPAWTEDTKIKEFFGPVTGPNKVKFDTGIRLDIAGGYRFTDWVAAEIQTGVIYNSIDEVQGGDAGDSSLCNFPVMFNGVFELPTRTKFVPFAGGGIGVSATTLDVEDLTFNEFRTFGDDTTAVFAYQAFAGVKYKVTEQFGVSLAYRYFGTDDPDWGDHGDRIRMDGIRTHSVTLGVSFQF